MKMPRAILIMLTGLAGGIGGRLAFPSPVTEGPARSRGSATERTVRITEQTTKTEAAGGRPDEAAVLAVQGGSRLRLLLAWLPGAGEEELRRMADALTEPDDYSTGLDTRLLMARWAEVNPEAMFAWERARFEVVANSSYYNDYSSPAIEAWARVDFDRVWETVGTGLAGLRRSALRGLATTDPDKCLRLLRADPSLMDLPGYPDMASVLNRIAARDGAGMAAFLDSGPATRLANCAGSVALAWAKSDPAAAVAWMARMESGVRAVAAEAAGKWIATHAPEHLSALLESLPPGRARSIIEAEGFGHLAATDITTARQQLDEMPASPSRQYRRGLLMKELLRRGDEAGASALATQLGWNVNDEWYPDSTSIVGSFPSMQGYRGDIWPAMQELMGRISARNPQEAAAILAKSEHGIAEGLLTGEKETNPAGLAAALLAAGDDNAREDCEKLVTNWSMHDPAGAAAWALAHGGASRDKILEQIMDHWASDPPAMLQWAATVDADTVSAAWKQVVEVDHAFAAAHLDQFLPAASPEAVENLLSQLGDLETERRVLRQLPENLDVSIEGTVASWMNDEPEEAVEWVRSLPPGTRRDMAASAVAGYWSDTGNYEDAFAWAVTLPAEQRAAALGPTIEAWSKDDPAAAESAIIGSDLPAEERQKLLETLPPP